MIIPTSLSIAYSGVCWEHHTRTLSKQTSNNIFSGVISFSEKCKDYLYSPSNNTVGEISLTELVNSYTELLKSKYNDLSASLSQILPNQTDSVRYDETEKKYLGTLNDRIEKLDAMEANYKLISESFGDKMKIYNHSLVGLSKKCFSDSESYKTIWNWGMTGKMLGLDQYIVMNVGSRLLNQAVNEILFGKKELERKLAEENKIVNENLLQNKEKRVVSKEGNLSQAEIQTKSEVKLKNPKLYKTINQNVTKLSEMQRLASLSVSNLYKVESDAKTITKAILATSIFLLILLAISEHSHRVQRKNTATKICMVIFFAIFGLGLLVCLALLIIIHSDISGILNRLKENRCLDQEILQLLEGDLYISGHKIGVIVSFVLMVFGVILGLLCSCGLWGRKYGYSKGRPSAPRFR